MTFESMAQLEQAREWHEIELIEEKIIEDVPKTEIEDIQITEITIEDNESDKIEESTVETIDILNKDNINKYTVKTFREKLEHFTDEELRVFIHFDSRQTIVKEAKKELEKRNR
jgi:hypothetical protein